LQVDLGQMARRTHGAIFRGKQQQLDHERRNNKAARKPLRDGGFKAAYLPTCPLPWLSGGLRAGTPHLFGLDAL
jgi:hypothetical protein